MAPGFKGQRAAHTDKQHWKRRGPHAQRQRQIVCVFVCVCVRACDVQALFTVFHTPLMSLFFIISGKLNTVRPACIGIDVGVYINTAHTHIHTQISCKEQDLQVVSILPLHIHIQTHVYKSYTRIHNPLTSLVKSSNPETSICASLL